LVEEAPVPVEPAAALPAEIKEVQKLRLELQAAQLRIRGLQEDLVRIRKAADGKSIATAEDLNEAHARVQELEQQRITLRQEVASLREKITHGGAVDSEALAKAQDRIHELEQQRAALRDEVAAFREKVASTPEEARSRDEELQRLNQEFLASRAEISALKEQLATIGDEAVESFRQREETERALRAAKENAETALLAAKDASAQFASEANRRDEEIGRLRKVLAEARQQVADLQAREEAGKSGDPEEPSRLRKALASAAARASAAEQAQAAMSAELEAVKSRLASMPSEARLAELEARFTGLRSKASARISELERALNEERGRHASVSAPGSESEATAKLQLELARIQARFAQAEARCKALARLPDEMEATKKKLAEVLKENENLRKSVTVRLG
jgi:chromosome segregation ATPase